MLVDDYYRIKELTKPQTVEDLIIMQAQSVKELRAHVTQVEDKLTNVNYRIDSLTLSTSRATPGNG